VEVVKWYGADRFCLFLGGKLNESETCGLGLELDLNLRPMDLGLTISESEDLDLEEADLYLPLWDLTTSLWKGFENICMTYSLALNKNNYVQLHFDLKLQVHSSFPKSESKSNDSEIIKSKSVSCKSKSVSKGLKFKWKK